MLSTVCFCYGDPFKLSFEDGDLTPMSPLKFGQKFLHIRELKFTQTCTLSVVGSCRGVMEVKRFSWSAECGRGLNVPKPKKTHSTGGAKQCSKAGGQNPPCWCCWVRWGYLPFSWSPPGDSSPGNHRAPERALFQFHRLWEPLVAKNKRGKEKMSCSMFIIISVVLE